MNRCPDPSDLERFFGATAVPEHGPTGDWVNDNLQFTTWSGTFQTVCSVLAARGFFAIRHLRDGHLAVDLSLRHVVSLDLESSAGSQVLIGHVVTESLQQLFKLRLVPEFSFLLTTDSEA